MACHDTDIVIHPTATLSTFLSLSINSSAAQQYLIDYLQSTLHCQDIQVDLFVVPSITQLQFVYSPVKGPSLINLLKIFEGILRCQHLGTSDYCRWRQRNDVQSDQKSAPKHKAAHNLQTTSKQLYKTCHLLFCLLLVNATFMTSYQLGKFISSSTAPVTDTALNLTPFLPTRC